MAFLFTLFQVSDEYQEYSFEDVKEVLYQCIEMNMISKDIYTLIAVVCDDHTEEENNGDHYIVKCCPEHQRLDESFKNCKDDDESQENFIAPRNVLHYQSLTMMGAKHIQRKQISEYSTNIGCQKKNKTSFIDSILTNGQFFSSPLRLSTQPYFCIDKVKGTKVNKSSFWIAIVCQDDLEKKIVNKSKMANNVYTCLDSHADILR